MIIKTGMVLFASGVFLSACGGGGSSSGSDVADKDVTRCIKAERVDTPSGTFDSEARYTNNCDFAVSLAYEIAASAKGPVTLTPNASHRDIFGATQTGKFIACRPPSQATNRGSNLDVRLDCT